MTSIRASKAVQTISVHLAIAVVPLALLACGNSSEPSQKDPGDTPGAGGGGGANEGGGGEGGASGDGGSGGGASATSTGTQDPSKIPGPAYGAKCANMDAQELAAWEAIAVVRGKAGLPPLDCNSAIQNAARAHSSYCAVNGQMTHQEEMGKPGFTGVNFWDRMSAAGFKGPAAFEVMAGGGDAKGAVGMWMNSVYHRTPFLSFDTKMYGFSAKGGAYSTCDFAAGGSAPPGVTVVSWPVDGDSGLPTTFYSNSEGPDPIPDADAVGSPISITGAGKVVLTAHTLTGPGGAAVAHYLLGGMGAAVGFIPDNMAFMLAKKPLSASASYTATFKGTAGTKAFTKVIRFKTAAK